MITHDQLTTLYRMLRLCRPHGSGSDDVLRLDWIKSLPGIREDRHGNLIVDVGSSPSVLWSCHTDTVHRHAGLQEVHVDTTRHTIQLARKWRKRSACLGADDTVGVFLMREMILAGAPGRYIFHYGEEAGCIGSFALAQDTPETLDGITFAIALDRANREDVITHQHGKRCASNVFALSLAAQLSAHGCNGYKPATGIYTDTAEYMDLLCECTNLSVGYFRQHSPDEWIDYAHVGKLLHALIHLDQSALVCGRAPGEDDPPVAYVPRFYGHTHSSPGRIDDAKYHRPVWARDYSPADYDYSEDWTEDYGWCDVCCALIIADGDPNKLRADDVCVCEVPPGASDLELDLALTREELRTLSADDLKFLRYLRGLQ